MAEHLLHDPQVGAVVEQVRGARVAQHVRRQVIADAGPVAVLVDHEPCPLPAEAAAALVQEHRLGVVAALPPIGNELGPARRREPVVERRRRCRSVRHDALLRSLAEQPHERLVEVDVTHRQPDHLGDPGAGRVQQLEQRPVAAFQRAVADDRVEQARHLRLAERLGDARRDADAVES